MCRVRIRPHGRSEVARGRAPGVLGSAWDVGGRDGRPNHLPELHGVNVLAIPEPECPRRRRPNRYRNGDQAANLAAAVPG
jgi:hypothetical protein